MKTYSRKKKNYFIEPKYTPLAVNLSSSLEIPMYSDEERPNKQIFDSTFDRIAHGVKPPPPARKSYQIFFSSSDESYSSNSLTKPKVSLPKKSTKVSRRKTAFGVPKMPAKKLKIVDKSVEETDEENTIELSDVKLNSLNSESIDIENEKEKSIEKLLSPARKSNKLDINSSAESSSSNDDTEVSFPSINTRVSKRRAILKSPKHKRISVKKKKIVEESEEETDSKNTIEPSVKLNSLNSESTKVENEKEKSIEKSPASNQELHGHIVNLCVESSSSNDDTEVFLPSMSTRVSRRRAIHRAPKRKGTPVKKKKMIEENTEETDKENTIELSDTKLNSLSFEGTKVDNKTESIEKSIDEEEKKKDEEEEEVVSSKQRFVNRVVVLKPLNLNNNTENETDLQISSDRISIDENSQINLVPKLSKMSLSVRCDDDFISSTPLFKKPLIKMQRLIGISPINCSYKQPKDLLMSRAETNERRNESEDLFSVDSVEAGRFQQQEESQKKTVESSSIMLTPDSTITSSSNVSQSKRSSAEETDSFSVIDSTPNASIESSDPSSSIEISKEQTTLVQSKEDSLSVVNSTQSESFIAHKLSKPIKIDFRNVKKDLSCLYDTFVTDKEESQVNSESNSSYSSNFSQDITDGKKHDNDKVESSDKLDGNQSSIAQHNYSSSGSLFSPSTSFLSSAEFETEDSQSNISSKTENTFDERNASDLKKSCLNYSKMPVVLLERLNASMFKKKRRLNCSRIPVVLLERLNESVFVKKSHLKCSKMPVVLLERLDEAMFMKKPMNNSIFITERQHKNILDETSESENSNLSVKNKTNITSASSEDDSVIESSINKDTKLIYLRPGKSWARSLSILNRIRNDQDIEDFPNGKGKKWGKSVRGLLSMQFQHPDIEENSNAEDEMNKSMKSTIYSRSNNYTCNQSLKSIYRKSMRVIADRKSELIEENVQDPLFLKAHGIDNDFNKSTKKSTLQVQGISSTHFNQPTVDSLPPKPVIAAKDAVISHCKQKEVISFAKRYTSKYLSQCRKIGEGVYGEVFLHENGKNSTVIKVIPIEGEKLVNGEPQKKFHEILSEIIIAKELHKLRHNKDFNTNGFIEVKNIKYLKGKYPPKLIELWDEYDESKNSENDSPKMFGNDQLYISLEFGMGGTDMESFEFKNAVESYSVFIQIAMALAVAEKALEFEHRDLHWGNVLISRNSSKNVSCIMGDEQFILPCNGVKAFIIDFTLSRMSYTNCCIFNDLAVDPALFTAVGDYQFDIYRLMQKEVKNNWQSFEPKTNIFWLHYILGKLISLVYYDKNKMKTKIHKVHVDKLKELEDTILNYSSAHDFIMNCDKLVDTYERKYLV